MYNEIYNSMLQGIETATYQLCLLLLLSDAVCVNLQIQVVDNQCIFF